jgi:putative addiction module component (TIGR02574 family)
MSTEDLIALPPEERLALIAALWESLGEAPPLPAVQAAELASRLQSFENERAAAVAWDALKAELARRQS